MNTVQKEAYVAIDYTLKLGSGKVVDQSQPGDPLGFIAGQRQIIPGLEEALEGKVVGDAFSVTIPAAEGYGEVDEEMVQTMPRRNFPKDAALEVDTVYQAQTPHGAVSFRVKEVKDEEIVVDFNHPLAGEDLHFDVKVVEVREATEEDFEKLNHHGCGGSHDCGGGSHDCGSCCC